MCVLMSSGLGVDKMTEPNQTKLEPNQTERFGSVLQKKINGLVLSMENDSVLVPVPVLTLEPRTKPRTEVPF